MVSEHATTAFTDTIQQAAHKIPGRRHAVGVATREQCVQAGFIASAELATLQDPH